MEEKAVNDTKLRVIKGGLHHTVQKTEKVFSSAFATNTRLMGVFVIYIHWTFDIIDFDSNLHQFFYVDAEEFGIESYRGIVGSDFEMIYEVEQTMLGGLGGTKVELSEKEAVYLVQKYADMTKANGSHLPPGREEFLFILSKPASMTLLEENALLYKLCASMETNEQVINYFLMRFFAKDTEAVKYLSTKPVILSAAPNKNGETLCKNTIELYDNPDTTSYLCESLIENNNRYQLILSEIYLDAKRVASFHIRSSFFISTSEAAMLLARPEYITVYEIMGDPDDVRKSISKLHTGALQKNQDSGYLFLQFKSNNDHLKEAVYRLNDDIRGIFYVTEYCQLVVVSYSLGSIGRIEKELQIAMGPVVTPIAKYEFKESVFYEFVQGDFTEFSEFMDYLNEFEPDV
jgi:hypothetical protein